jgi:hypothetical protein
VEPSTSPPRGCPILPLPRLLPNHTIDDLHSDLIRTVGPPPVVIIATYGVDPNAFRDPSKLNDASPFFSTTSESPRTP